MREEECYRASTPAPPPPTHTDVRGSVSNRQTGTYLYIGAYLSQNVLPLPKLDSRCGWGPRQEVLAMLRKGSWITLC